ncbi:MAG: hypothetical protein IPI36_07075 [Chitinophagaceae bacterium]|nr:hypothetical protein [Chitinophagaceae bacterium]
MGWPEGFRINQSIFPFYNIILPLAEKSIKKYDWTVSLENDEGKHKINEYFYDNNKLCIKENSSVETQNTYANLFKGTDILNRVKENKFNPDKTLLETNVYVDDKRIQTTRYYYFKV